MKSLFIGFLVLGNVTAFAEEVFTGLDSYWTTGDNCQSVANKEASRKAFEKCELRYS